MHYDLDKIAGLLRESPNFTRSGLVFFDQIDSTNTWLMSQDQVHGRVCLAGYQSAGRGRRNKPWVGQSGGSLLISLGWRLKSPFVPGLSLVSGLAVKKALEAVGVPGIQLKWPNDIMCRGRKLGGILVESVGGNYVIGVGLNLALDASIAVDQPWIDLAAVGVRPDLEELVAYLIVFHDQMVSQVSALGFAGFVEPWNQSHAYHDRAVEVITVSGTVRGTAKGVNQQGALLVQDPAQVHAIQAGVESVRLQETTKNTGESSR